MRHRQKRMLVSGDFGVYWLSLTVSSTAALPLGRSIEVETECQVGRLRGIEDAEFRYRHA